MPRAGKPSAQKNELQRVAGFVDSVLLEIEHDSRLSVFKGNEKVLAPVKAKKDTMMEAVNSTFRRAVLTATCVNDIKKLGQAEHSNHSLQAMTRCYDPLVEDCNAEVVKLQKVLEPYKSQDVVGKRTKISR